MSRHDVGLSLLVCLLGWSGSAAHAGGYGFDVVLPPAQYAEQLETGGGDGRSGTWMRVRGLVDHHRVKQSATRTVESDRAGLRALRERGIKTAVFLRWNPNSWSGGVGPGGGHRMPLDLREAFARGKGLGETYGDLVDVWEIDNEPDIDYGPDNPETYAAFLKALYLGLKAGGAQVKPEAVRTMNLTAKGAKGREIGGTEDWPQKAQEGTKGDPEAGGGIGRKEAQTTQKNPDGDVGVGLGDHETHERHENGVDGEVGGRLEDLTAKGAKGREGSPNSHSEPQKPVPYLRYPVHQGHPGFSGVGRRRNVASESLSLRAAPRGARVIMAPLALPPGPYLERLWANGIASYTDGFNFHYYGYAEDFTGVYRQFEDAVSRLSAEGEEVTAKGAKRREGAQMKPETGGLRPVAGGLRPKGWPQKAQEGTKDDPASSGEVGRKEAQETQRNAERTVGATLQVSDLEAKSLPVFITEYGYGLLDVEARDNVEGRVRQWRWFADVVSQVRALRPEAPMAFLWNPYIDSGLNEFGLMMKGAAGVESGEGKSETGRTIGFTAKGAKRREDGRTEGWPQKAQEGAKEDPESGGEIGRKEAQTAQKNPGGVMGGGRGNHETHERHENRDGVGRTRGLAGGMDVATTGGRAYRREAQGGAGELLFVPSDFGATRVRPWMRRIGQRVGEWYASPALAYLWDYAERNPYRPRDWTVRAARASSVVIDFVAGQDMDQAKSSGGYTLRGASVEWSPSPISTGRGSVVLYNFGERAVTGTLEIVEPSPVAMEADEVLTLAPGERREIAVRLRVPGERWEAWRLSLRFVPVAEAGETKAAVPAVPPYRATAVFSTLLYPATYGMAATRVAGFDFADSGPMSAVLEKRPLAMGEPRLRKAGRWLVSDGVRVTETAEGVWRFHVDYLPAEAMRPAMVELPLAPGLKVGSGVALSLERRKVPAEAGARMPGVDEGRYRSRAGRAGDMMDVYFRTENGNLYQTWPRLRVTEEWGHYREPVENFTMAFFGRAELPWRFAENTPAALVFFLRVSEVPATFEVRGAEIVRLGEGE